MARRLSLKSFKFKIQKSQMQLCTHEVVQRKKIQGQNKKKPRQNQSTAHHTSSSVTLFRGPRV